jgi:membrane protease YdiL (CAAX protease family)
MSAPQTAPPLHAVHNDSRIRAYIQFVAAIFYYILVRILAGRASLGLTVQGIVPYQWQPLLEQAMLVFLLLLGFSGMGFSLNRQHGPISAQGFPFRRGFFGEIGLGFATGWTIALIGVAAMALFGGIAIQFLATPASWIWLLVDVAYFLLLTLAEEIAFRGYAFQRLSRALGSTVSVLAFSLLYAVLIDLQPGANHASVFVAFVFSFLLFTAYLRTRALWVSWGLNFGWKATRALLFGLTVAGNSQHSPIVEGNPMGGFWLTGGGFGLDGSWFTFLVLLAFLPVLYRLTRDLNFRFNAPEIIPGGIPVDIDAAARKQHEAAMGQAEPAAPALVQIAPVSTPPPVVNNSSDDPAR